MATLQTTSVLITSEEETFSCVLENVAGDIILTCASSPNINSGELGSLAGTPGPLGDGVAWGSKVSALVAAGDAKIAEATLAGEIQVGGPYYTGGSEEIENAPGSAIDDPVRAVMLEHRDSDDGLSVVPARYLLRFSDSAMAVVPRDVAEVLEAAIAVIS